MSDKKSRQFITNQQDFLASVFTDILPMTDQAKFLVGYFYFSGFQKIYDSLRDIKLQILVGMEVEKDLKNKLKEFERLDEDSVSRGQVKQRYFESLVQLFNDTDYFDTPQQQDAFKLFCQKIQDGTLEIRKTLQPNHAKLYLFKRSNKTNEGGRNPGILITGSSNLSAAGLEYRDEVNVILRDAHFYEEGEAFFDKLWMSAVDIVGSDNNEDFYSQVLTKIWYEKTPKPFLLYVRVLAEYFSIVEKPNLKLPSEITKNKIVDLKYQIDAIQQAISTIAKHNGVIIADVVGLGKSIIASAVAHNLGMKTIIIAPPHLTAQWEDYRHNLFQFNAKVYSSGRIEQALGEQNNDNMLIIIDEAHKYRNEATLDYALLHQLCQGNKVILLTATPFNNRPQDVFSMIKLFQIPSRSTIQTVDNLGYQFRELIKEYKSIKKAQRQKLEGEAAIKERIKLLAEAIRNIISPLVIRRSRLDLDAIEEYRIDLDAVDIHFPEVADPEILEYDLGGLSQLYADTLEEIAPDNEKSGFIGARYKPVTYLKNIQKYKQKIADEFGDEALFQQSQRNLAKFMRHLLVRRFESSVAAFQSTLRSMIRSSEYICDWYEKVGKVPIYKKGKLPDVDSLLESIDEEARNNLEDYLFEKELAKYYEKGLQLVESKELRKGFIEDVKKDIVLLEEIYNNWFENGIQSDPKLESFKLLIKDQLKYEPNRKLIVFSEFADTTDYLFERLKNEFRVAKYSSRDASEANKQIIRENFDAGYSKQKNDFDILIATDAISEGYNLHRAGTIFNYDIPYNPTRVIQRIGRINRVNKKVFEKLYIYNFFPTATGEQETKVKEISTLKIDMIQALMGEDMKILTSDEELTAYYADEYRRLMQNQDELSWDVPYRSFLGNLRQTNPELIKEALSVPKRTRIRRTVKKEQAGVIVFGKKAEEYTFKLGKNANEYLSLTAKEALELFYSEPTENSTIVSENFEKTYQHVKSNLFSRRFQVAKDRGSRDSILKVEELTRLFPQQKDYLEDLRYVIRDLDSLPEKYQKQIRSFTKEEILGDFSLMKDAIPHAYLIKIIKTAQGIEEGTEVLILAEELI